MDYPISFPDQWRTHLRALRKVRGLTQAQLGAKLGVGQTRIAEIEAGPGQISVEQLMKTLSALGASLVLRDAGGSDDSIERKQDRDTAQGAVLAPVPTAQPGAALPRKAGTRTKKLVGAPNKGSW